MPDNRFHFNNGKFKIMQISDAQELPKISPDTVRLIRMALAAENPDLVVFTGDQVYGIHPKIWSERSVRRVLTALLAPVVEAGVPFAVTFGNHDEECGIPNAALAKTIYAGFPGYTPGERRDDSDPGTFRIPVYGADGTVLFDIFAFDTHGSTVSVEKRGVSDAQLAWFEALRGAERKANGSAPPALVFQHIAVPEFYRIVRQVPKGTDGAVEAFGARKNTFYALPEEILSAGGFMKESPSTGGTEEFGVLKRDGGVIAIAVGHDHNNSFSAPYEGVDLIYTQGAGFHTYGPHLKRGVRVFVLDEEDPAAYTSYTRTWEDLTEDRPEKFIFEAIISNTPSSIAQAKALAIRKLPYAAAGIGMIALIAGIRRKK